MYSTNRCTYVATWYDILRGTTEGTMVYTRSIQSTQWTHMTGSAKQVAKWGNNRGWAILSPLAISTHYKTSNLPGALLQTWPWPPSTCPSALENRQGDVCGENVHVSIQISRRNTKVTSHALFWPCILHLAIPLLSHWVAAQVYNNKFYVNVGYCNYGFPCITIT